MIGTLLVLLALASLVQPFYTKDITTRTFTHIVSCMLLLSNAVPLWPELPLRTRVLRLISIRCLYDFTSLCQTAIFNWDYIQTWWFTQDLVAYDLELGVAAYLFWRNWKDCVEVSCSNPLQQHLNEIVLPPPWLDSSSCSAKLTSQVLMLSFT